MKPSTEVKRWKLVFSDDRDHLPVSQENYNKVVMAKSDGKYSDFIKIQEDGQILYFWELGKIKEIIEINVEAINKKNQENNYYNEEEKRLLRIKKINKEWTENFLRENDQDGSIMKNAKDEARERMSTALSKWMVGEKFIEELANMIIREAYQH